MLKGGWRRSFDPNIGGCVSPFHLRCGSLKKVRPQVEVEPEDDGEADEEVLGSSSMLERLLESMERESLSEQTLDSVLRIYCTHVQPSFAAPWQKLQQISSTSSGAYMASKGPLPPGRLCFRVCLYVCA